MGDCISICRMEFYSLSVCELVLRYRGQTNHYYGYDRKSFITAKRKAGEARGDSCSERRKLFEEARGRCITDATGTRVE